MTNDVDRPQGPVRENSKLKTSVIVAQYDRAASSEIIKKLRGKIGSRAIAAIAGGDTVAIVAKFCAESYPEDAEAIFEDFLKAG